MASYLVLEPAGTDRERVEKAIILRDGFAFLAFLAPFLWFLWHRMWLEALAVLALGLALAALSAQPAYSGLGLVLSLLLSALIGLEAQALRAAALRRRGFHDWGVVEGANRAEAEMRYLAETAREDGPAPARSAPAAPPRPGASSFDLLDVSRGS